MAQRIGRFRRKTRSKLKKGIKEKGKISISNYLNDFKENDRVLLKAEPAVQKGMYFRRYHGRTGVINKKRGNCYEIKIKDRDKEKILIVHPVHLNKLLYNS